MKLIIYNKDNYDKLFIYDYLPTLIYKYFNSSYDTNRLKRIDDVFGIDSLNSIKFALKNLKIYEQPDAYIIEINKNLRYKDNNIDSLINLITNGNRECKGYLIVYNIFKLTAENIDNIYKE